MDQPLYVYIPIDRRQALARQSQPTSGNGGTLHPEHARGAVLGVEITGLALLAKVLRHEMGLEKGAELLARQTSLIYEALIEAGDRLGGSTLSISGERLLLWFESATDKEAAVASRRAVACALAMHGALGPLSNITLPAGGVVQIGMRAAVASGRTRRFLVGDPTIQVIDVLVGEIMGRLSHTLACAGHGEVVVCAESARLLGDTALISEWRHGGEGGRPSAEPTLSLLAPQTSVTIVRGLVAPVTAAPWIPLAGATMPETQVRPWLPPSIRAELHEEYRWRQPMHVAGVHTEFRLATLMALQFEGIDWRGDDEAGQRLDAYIRWVQEVLQREGGLLVELTTNEQAGMLGALFNTSDQLGENAARALGAARALRTPPAHLSTLRPAKIGVSQGLVAIGVFGSSSRRAYGVLGVETSIAQQLMQHAAPGSVLTSARVRQAADERFTWQPVASIQVKEHREPFPVFVMVEAQTHRTLQLPEPTAFLPLVGREMEMARLEQRIDEVLQGQGHLVGILGEAGIGKSRLLAEIVRVAELRGVRGYGGYCQPDGINRPYLAWRPIWQAFFGIYPDMPLADQIHTLEHTLEQLAPSLLPRLPLLGTVLGIPIPDNDTTRALDPLLRKNSREALLIDCLRARIRISGEEVKPLVVVLEDAHWLDPLSLELLEAISRVIAGLPVLIFLAYRPPEAEAPAEVWHKQGMAVFNSPHFTEVPLGPLGPKAVERLIHNHLAQYIVVSAPSGFSAQSVAPEIVEWISSKAGGVPLVIEEMLHALLDQGLSLQAPDPRAWGGIPSSLSPLLLSRLQQLSEPQQAMLRVASILGRSFSVEQLQGYAPTLGEGARIESELNSLTQRALIVPDHHDGVAHYLFKHTSIQEAVYSSLSAEVRATLHEQFARYLESTARREKDLPLDLLAYHYGLSLNLEKKRSYLRQAAEAARAASANEVAIDYYERLLALFPEEGGVEREEQIEILFALGEMLELVARWADAEARYRHALKMAQASNDRLTLARCHTMLGRLLHRRGDYRQALSWLWQAKAGFESCHQSSATQAKLCQTLIEIGFVYWLQGEIEAATAALEESLAMARGMASELWAKHSIARILSYLGMMAYGENNYEMARVFYEEKLTLRREIGDKQGIAATLNNLGNVAYAQGNYPVAREFYSESLALRWEIGDKQGIAVSLGNMGQMMYEQGEYAAARAMQEESLALVRELGDKRHLALLLNTLGNMVLSEGDHTAAKNYCTESLALAEDLGDKLIIARSLVGMAGISLYAAPDPAGPQEGTLRAAHLLASTDALLTSTRAVMEMDLRALYDGMVATVRTKLGGGFAAAWSEGRSLSLEQAVALARSL